MEASQYKAVKEKEMEYAVKRVEDIKNKSLGPPSWGS